MKESPQASKALWHLFCGMTCSTTNNTRGGGIHIQYMDQSINGVHLGTVNQIYYLQSISKEGGQDDPTNAYWFVITQNTKN